MTASSSPSPNQPADEHDTARPLQVAIDVGPLYGHRTGVGVAVQGMVNGLASDDRVRLAPYLVSARSTAHEGHRKLPVPGIVASHLWSRFDRPRADRWMGGVDLVHGTNYVAPPTALPTVVSVYDCWFLANPGQATPIVRRAAANLRRAVRRGAWVHTGSDAIAEQIRDLLATDRVVTVHLGPPPEAPALDELTRPEVADAIAGRPYVLAVATEERRKNLTLLVDAFERMTDTDTTLVLAGASGDLSDDLTARIRQLPAGTAGRVFRLGPVSDATKQWLVRQASVLAYPSHDEGFGFPVLEAQAAGTPVVARPVGSIPEVGGDGALLVTGSDADDFAEALGRVLHEGTLRLGLIEAGHRNVRRFSWDDTVDGLRRLYRRAIGTHR